MNTIYEQIMSNLKVDTIYNTNLQTIDNFTCEIDSNKLFNSIQFTIMKNNNSLPQYDKFIRAQADVLTNVDKGEFKLVFNPFSTIQIKESTKLYFGITFRFKDIYSSGGIHLTVDASGQKQYPRPIYKFVNSNDIRVFNKTIYTLNDSDYSDLISPNKGWIDIDVFYTPTLTKVYKDGVLMKSFNVDLLKGVTSIEKFKPYHCVANSSNEMNIDFTRSTLIDFTDNFYYTQNFNNDKNELTTLVIPFTDVKNTITQIDALDIDEIKGSFNDLNIYGLVLNPYERQYLIQQNIENDKLNRHFYFYDLINLKPFI